MTKQPKILIIWSNYYKNLADRQLANCKEIIQQSKYNYKIETVTAGSYEIPAVLSYYHQCSPFDGYLPLGLLLKGNTDHYEFIWQHLKECFIKFALSGISLGNGIISAPNLDILTERVENGERVQEAFNALDYLISLKQQVALAPQ